MRRRVLLTAPLALGLARCASPDPAIYTLRAVPGTVGGGGPAAVKIARPGLAGYLDRPEIVRDSTVSRLKLNSGERWGEPLGDMIGRVLALDLAQRLGGTSVFTEAGTISVDPSATVELDIQRFDLDQAGAVIMQVQVAVQRGRSHDPEFTNSLRLTATPASAATPDVVAAMSQVLGQLADTVAASLRRIGPTALTGPGLVRARR